MVTASLRLSYSLHLFMYHVLLSFKSYKVISEMMYFHARWIVDLKAHIK